jgi:hypothetical protein
MLFGREIVIIRQQALRFRRACSLGIFLDSPQLHHAAPLSIIFIIIPVVRF